MAKPQEPFFVGWGKVPKALKTFLALSTASFVISFAVAAFAISATQTDTGSGAFMGQANAVGIMKVDPYPVLHVIESDKFEKGDVVLLSGGGKRGVFNRAKNLDGEIVQLAGLRMERGDLDGLQLRGGMRGLSVAENPDPEFEIEVEPLGRWKLAGEICDGKCLTGAMRPGNGLAHKACANLCLIGDVPPIFVSSGPVEGHEFLLMAGADGKRLGDEILDFTATYVEIEGEIERRGGMLVFKIDTDTIRLAK
ncbi:hypothetical protein N9L47_03460 [Rhodobacteraceae bacterium]|nr:hypothetical protein [Paracoccaceae bacterium]